MSRHVAVALLLLCCALPGPSQAPFPGREVAKPQAEVWDTFLGYIVGLVDADIEGFADGALLDRIMPEFDAFLSLPFEEILRVSRARDARGAFVRIDFRSPITLPIPFRILWDTPGSIHADRRVTLRETRIPAHRVSGPGGPLLSPLYVYDVVQGSAGIDFDPWIDGLLGAAVDDVEIRRVLLFRMEDRWYGALLGPGYAGQLVAGYFDLGANRILVPASRRLRSVGLAFGQEIGSSSDLRGSEP
jgi:hypothetical protein